MTEDEGQDISCFRPRTRGSLNLRILLCLTDFSAFLDAKYFGAGRVITAQIQLPNYITKLANLH